MSELYFYSGQTQEIKGETILFSGIWGNKEGKSHVEVMQQIVVDKEVRFGCHCSLTSFNALPDEETTGERP